MRIIFATGNEGKLREIKAVMGELGYEILSMKDAGINVEIDENGESFEENALIKARAVAAVSDDLILADDSGLEVDYLDRQPGIHSARFMGEDTPYDVKNRAILEKLNGVPEEKRTARFVCAVAAVLPDKTEKCVRETFEGYIGYEPEGKNGFGYDPIFQVPERGCSSASLSPEEKNAISHRGRALRAMYQTLKDAGF